MLLLCVASDDMHGLAQSNTTWDAPRALPPNRQISRKGILSTTWQLPKEIRGFQTPEVCLATDAGMLGHPATCLLAAEAGRHAD